MTPHRSTRSCAGSPRCARYMREHQPGPRPADESIAAAVGMTGEQIDDMYRLLAIAKYDERYVIPPAHAEQAHSPGGAGHRVQPGLRGRPGHGRLGPVRRGLRRHRPRSRWRTSRCCRTGRPADTIAGRRTTRPRPGQPAELGRQGPPRRPVPAAAATTTGRRGAGPATAPTARPRRRCRAPAPVAWQAARCCSATPTSELARAVPACCAAASPASCRAGRPSRSARSSTTSSRRRCRELARRLRRDLRPPAPLLPVPDLLRARRHPQARHGAAAVQDRPTGPPASSSPTASCPTTWPCVLEFAATGDPAAGRRAAAGAPRRAWSCCGWRWRDAGSPWADVRRRRSAPPCRRWRGDDREAVRRLAAAGAAGRGGRPGAVRAARVHARAARPCPAPAHRRASARGARPGRPLMTPCCGWSSRTSAWRSSSVGHLWRYRYDKFGWTTRSSQLYENRAAAAGQPAVPLRHPVRAAGPRRWASASRSRGPTRSASPRALYHASAVGVGTVAGICTVVGHGHPDLPAPHRRPGVLGHHPRWTRRCTSCSATVIVLGLGNTVRRPTSSATTTTARASRSGSAASSASSRTRS